MCGNCSCQRTLSNANLQRLLERYLHFTILHAHRISAHFVAGNISARARFKIEFPAVHRAAGKGKCARPARSPLSRPPRAILQRARPEGNQPFSFEGCVVAGGEFCSADCEPPIGLFFFQGISGIFTGRGGGGGGFAISSSGSPVAAAGVPCCASVLHDAMRACNP